VNYREKNGRLRGKLGNPASLEHWITTGTPLTDLKDGDSLMEDGKLKDAMPFYERAMDKLTVLIESTSGNMGINMAFMAALKVYRLLLTRPSYTSLERRVKMMSFGAHLILTDLTKAMRGTVKKAYDFWENTPEASMLLQFSNPAKQ
ncbi:bifunctional L-3-cyanoalanine synthase/cysteine synthase 1, mitochondrial, partial [Tanacetum coccineum]